MDIRKLPRAERRAAAKYLKSESKKYSDKLVQLPMEDWADAARKGSVPVLAVWRSSKYLVQVYDCSYKYPGLVRVTVSRAAIGATGDWVDRIPWDALQKIKSAVGYAEHEGVEAYPKDEKVVNVANMRHIWIFTEDSPLAFLWGNQSLQ